MKKILLPFIAVCCFAPAAVFAGQQHPLLTDTAETVAPSKFEAETALEFGYNKVDSVKVSRITLQETVTGGIIPKLDGFITVPLSSISVDRGSSETNSGFEDVTAGVKYNVTKINTINLAVKPFLVLPTGDDKKGLGAGGFGIGAVGIVSVELDSKTMIDGNLMLKHQNTDGESYNEFGISVAGKTMVAKDLKAVAELAISKADADGAETQALIAAGAIYRFQKNIDVDAGIRIGLTKQTEDFALLAGVTFRF